MPRRLGKSKPSAKQDVDQITKEDLEIFRLGAINANYFTDHYMRSETSGTYWRNGVIDAVGDIDEDRQRAWEVLLHSWTRGGRPDGEYIFGPEGNQIRYIVQEDADKNPVFFHRHGILWIPWQLSIHHAPQPEVTVIGGFGSAKTFLPAISLPTLAATIPNFRGFAVAPQMLQAKEVYNYIKTNLAGTAYWDRWVKGSPEKPYPKIIVRNSYVGESTIEILSIEDDPEKVRTLEGDVLYLDQAEKFDDLDSVNRDAGSRLRGEVKGRARLGKMVWLANAGDNPQLWMRFDMMEHEPKHFLSVNPKSTDNPHLSKNDLRNLRRRVSAEASPEEIEQWMEGKRPMGSGEHFSRAMVKACTNDGLNQTIIQALQLPIGDPRRSGFVYEKSEILGLHHFEMPPDHASRRDYIVISDPGSGNPPKRNSPCIGVFDVTEFPLRPMRMVAFEWIYGYGSYWPWILAHQRYVETYRAYGRNAFDSTGVQKGFDELAFHELGIAAEGMDMSGPSKKMLAINTAKLFMGKAMMEMPYIAYLSNQLTNYRLPDNKIPQDLAMMWVMAADWARRLYVVELDDDEEDIANQRNKGEVERYDRPVANRYARPIAERDG